MQVCTHAFYGRLVVSPDSKPWPRPVCHQPADLRYAMRRRSLCTAIGLLKAGSPTADRPVYSGEPIDDFGVRVQDRSGRERREDPMVDRQQDEHEFMVAGVV